MAQTLIGLGGAWSTAANWAVCNSTAESDSEAVAGGTALTTSYVTSTTFTPGAITIDGIAVKVASRAASPTGTISVALDQGGSTVAGTEVTINVSDVDTALGWLLFKFTGVALSGATLYGVKAKTSSSSQINLHATATTNWSRELRTITTSASGPAAGDKLIITNQKTGTNAQSAITQTVDSDLSATTVGNTAYPQSIHVSNGGTVAFSTVSAANPKIKVAGIVQVYGGTWNQGNSAGDPVPSNSIADLAFAVSVNVDSGIVFANGSTANIYGYAKKSTQLKLAADFGGYCISDHTGVWASLIQGAGNNVTSGYPAGSWDTGASFANGNSITFMSTTTAGTSFAKTLAASNAIRNWSGVSITAASNAAACVLTYNGTVALTTGMYVYISGFTGGWTTNGSWTQCNGWQRVTSVSGTTFSIPINTTNLGAYSGSPVFSGSALNITVALAIDTSFGWMPKGGSAVITVSNLDGSSPDLSDWAAGDVFAIACTGRLPGECESLTVSSVDNTAKTITATGNLLYPHASMLEVATSGVQCEVINLTRNVKIHGATSSLQGYVLCGATAVVNVQYAEFYNLGSATTSKRGLDIQTTTGTFVARFNSFHDSSGVASTECLRVSGGSGQTAATLIISNNSFWNAAANGGAYIDTPNATTGTWLCDSNIALASGAGTVGTVFSLSDVGGTFTNNVAVGGGTGISANEVASFVSFSGNSAHGNSSIGISLIGSIRSCTISGSASWRNNGNAVAITAKALTIDGLVSLGNGTTLSVSNSFDLLFTNATLTGDVLFSTGNGCFWDGVANTAMESCALGVAGVLRAAHTSYDLGWSSSSVTLALRNCKLGSQTPILAFASSVVPRAFITSQKHQQTAGLHQFWLQYGIGSIDTSIFRTASPSLRLTPNTAGSKLESAPPNGYGMKAAVANGATLTPSVWIRRSVVGDGTAYNGNAPRLILRKNVALGIAADTVLATSSASAGTWEQLTTTTAAATDDGTMEFIVDCDGTAGWVSVDDWLVTPFTDTKGDKYWFNGVPNVAGDNGGGMSRGRTLIG